RRAAMGCAERLRLLATTGMVQPYARRSTLRVGRKRTSLDECVYLRAHGGAAVCVAVSPHWSQIPELGRCGDLGAASAAGRIGGMDCRTEGRSQRALWG